MTKIGEELQQLNEKMEDVSQKLQKIGFLLVQLLNRLPEKAEIESAAMDTSSLELIIDEAISKILEKKLPGTLQREIKGINEKITTLSEKISKLPKTDSSQINELQERLMPLLTELKTHDIEIKQNIEQNILDISSELKKLTSGKIKEAEEVMNRSTTLLEKGLALVELESLLREIKSYLEELVMGNKVIKDLDIDSKL